MQVASVSANCDPEIGDLIVRAFEKVGKDGVVTVSVSVSIFVHCSATASYCMQDLLVI